MHPAFLPAPLCAHALHPASRRSSCRPPPVYNRYRRHARVSTLHMCDSSSSSSSSHPQSSPSSASAPATSSSAEALPRMVTAASSKSSLHDALTDVAARSLAALSAEPDVAFIFVSAQYAVSQVGPRGRQSLASVVPKLRALLPNLKAVLGCCADGVIGARTRPDASPELISRPALSLTLAKLPNVLPTTFHIMPDDMPPRNASPAAWRNALRMSPVQQKYPPAAYIVLSDPAFAERGDLNAFLNGIAQVHPSATVVGSVASAGAAASEGHMYCTLPRDVLDLQSTSLRDNGLVGMTLSGDIQVDCLVAQGCRAVGPVFEVVSLTTSGAVNQIQRLGRPSSIATPGAHLKAVTDYATPQERRLLEKELHVGLAQPDASDERDYVICNVLAGNVPAPNTNLYLGAAARIGMRLRFFVKERDAAQLAIDEQMQMYKRAELAKSLVGYSNPPYAALMFVDAERGYKLFAEHDAETRPVTHFVGAVPFGGMFGSAQIAPVKNDVHQTRLTPVVHNAASVIALFRKRSALDPVNPPQSPANDTSAQQNDVDHDDNDPRNQQRSAQ